MDNVHFEGCTTTDIQLLDPERRVLKSNWKTLGAKRYWGFDELDVINTHRLVLLQSVDYDRHPRDIASITTPDIERTKGVLEQHNLAYDVMKADQIAEAGHILLNMNHTIRPGYGDVLIIGNTHEQVKKYVSMLTAQENASEKYEEIAELLGHDSDVVELIADMVECSCWGDVYGAAKNTTPSHDEGPVKLTNPNPFLNTLWRNMGLSFLYHPAPAFTKEKAPQTLQKAKLNYQLMKSIEGDIADKILTWLDLPSTWSGFHSIAQVKNAYSLGSYKTSTHLEKQTVYWKNEHSKTPDTNIEYYTDELETIYPNPMNAFNRH